MSERWEERVESPGAYVLNESRRHFCVAMCSSDHPPVLFWLSPGEGWGKLKKGTTTENQVYELMGVLSHLT